LVGLCHLELAEGSLPRHNINEIVLTWTTAKKRKIKVGDVIGDRDHPAYPNASPLPGTLTGRNRHGSPVKGVTKDDTDYNIIPYRRNCDWSQDGDMSK
jgi:hypothetical protein